MNVVVLINGREAIPVRAIPLVAPVPYGVRYLVEGLMCCDRSYAMHGLTAYRWSPEAEPPQAVPPTQWKQVDIRLHALKASLERQENSGLLSHEEGVDRYNRESVSILPAGVFVWKDDFVNARTRNLRRVPDDEIVALDDSWRDHIRFLQQQSELPANDPDVDQWEYALGENWRDQLAAYIAEERARDPVAPESIALYDRICCGEAPLTDVSFSPLVDPDLRKQVMEGFDRPEIDGRGAILRHAPKEDDLPRRFQQRLLEDGWENADRRLRGMPSLDAKASRVSMADEEFRAIASKVRLDVRDWIALTGVGLGQWGQFVVTNDAVRFRQWDLDFVATQAPSEQVWMVEDNQHEPLVFPCSPARLLEFVDSELCQIMSDFSVPQAFRQAVLVVHVPDDAASPVDEDHALATHPPKSAAGNSTIEPEAASSKGTTPFSPASRPIPQQPFQEDEILRVIAELEKDAMALPSPKPGKRGVKADVQWRLGFSHRVSNKAWERLRQDGRIRDRPSHSSPKLGERGRLAGEESP